ncbi:MAG: dipeptide ABC transporter ATP-binding protein [Trebonia sp.]
MNGKMNGAALAAISGADNGTSAEPGASLLEIRGLRVDYGYGPEATHAVDGADLTLHRGEVLGLAGESGSGKSTLVMAATRLLREPGVITGGQVTLYPGEGNQPVDMLDAGANQLRVLRWSEISLVMQSAMNALNPVMTIRRQLTDAIAAHVPEISASQRKAQAGELLEMVGINADRLSSYPHELSGGMRQRVMIAMALALRPQIVIMDEPTTALDVVTQREILEELKELRDQFGFAILFITHDLSLLIEMADSLAVMYAGRLVERAGANALFHAPRHPYTLGLLNSFPPLHGERVQMTGIPGSPPDLRALPMGCVFSPRCKFAIDKCYTEEPPLAPVGEGRVAACWLQHAGQTAPGELTLPEPDKAARATLTVTEPEPAAPVRRVPVAEAAEQDGTVDETVPLLEVRHLVKHYPAGGALKGRRALAGGSRERPVVHAVDDVSIALPPASVTAVVGESGSGKSTISRMMSGLVPPTKGELLLNGRPVRTGKRGLDYAKAVQMVLQDPFASLNPIHDIRYHLSRPFQVHGLASSRAEVDEKVTGVLERVSLTPAATFMAKYPHELSGGQRQRVAIARALAVEPKVLLADEPISMLDVSIRLGVLNLLNDMRERERIAILYVTHDIASARYLSDRIVVMYAGQVVESGPAVQVTDEPAHPYTQLLLSAAPDPERTTPVTLRGRGTPPSSVNPPSGCRFHPRCPYAMAICSEQAPPTFSAGPGHIGACWLLDPGHAPAAPEPKLAESVAADGESVAATSTGTRGRRHGSATPGGVMKDR